MNLEMTNKMIHIINIKARRNKIMHIINIKVTPNKIIHILNIKVTPNKIIHIVNIKVTLNKIIHIINIKVRPNKIIHIINIKMSYRAYNFIMKRILICSANQWTGFYMITASVMKELNILLNKEETNLLKFYFIYIKN